MDEVWNVLGITPTADARAVRRAYAARLKESRPDDDREGFMRLRAAYDEALEYAHGGGHTSVPALPDTVPDPAEPTGRAEGTPVFHPKPPPLPQVDPQRQRAVVEMVRARLAVDDDVGAAEVLSGANNDDEFVNLELRERLESEMVWLAAEYDPPPFQLVNTCANIFHWDDGRAFRDPSTGSTAVWLYDRLRARLRVKELRAIVAGTSSQPPPGPDRKYDGPVLDALLGPYRPWRFRWIMFKSRCNRAIVAYWLTVLETEAPGALENELDPKTVAWWRRAVSRPWLHAIHLVILLCFWYWLDPGPEPAIDGSEPTAILLDAAERGRVDAMPLVASRYLEGHDAARNVAKALHWFSMAAENESILGYMGLGYLYYEGIGVERDGAAALSWYSKAGDAGAPEGYFNVGLIYLQGIDIAPNFAASVDWFRRAAEVGHLRAQKELGGIYSSGYGGISPDPVKAAEWYLKAAYGGDVEAQYLAGNLYRSGFGLETDAAKAVSWLEKAALSGHGSAQVALGDIYRVGEGLPSDYSSAMRWYRIGASHRVPAAQNGIGVLYYRAWASSEMTRRLCAGTSVPPSRMSLAVSPTWDSCI
ncbi:MAG: sel1 repeat family protein [bacterium]|nr:sel1 repeat family protein [bacterium]